MYYHKDGKRLLWDVYPDADMMQALAIANLETMDIKSLGKYTSLMSAPTDVRCDLHPRWNTDCNLYPFI